MKELILTILRQFVDEEVGMIKGAKEKEVNKGRGSIYLGTPGNRTIISLSLLHQALQTTRTSNLSYISVRLQMVLRDISKTLKRAYHFNRFTTVPELIRWFVYSPVSTGRLSRIIIQSCNGNVELIDKLDVFLNSYPFYWDLINIEDTLRMIDEHIRQTSSPAISELKQLRVV